MKEVRQKRPSRYEPIYMKCPAGKFLETGSRLVATRGCGEGEWGVTTNGFPFGVMKMFWN